MANSNNWGEIYKSTWWGDKAWSANTLFIDSAPPGFGLNLLKGSEDLDNTIDWDRLPDTTSTPTVSANAVTDPNGGTTAERVDFTANRQARLQQRVTLEASKQYTFSVYAKVDTGTQNFRLRNVTLGDAESKTATTSWTRFSYTFTTTTAGDYDLSLQNNDNTARTLDFWGAMLNEGATAGDYVKTDASFGGSSPTPAYSGFGDSFGKVTAYYSLRQFTEAETLNAIRVRRSSDDTEQDIGFDANGDLDTSALTTFVNEDYDHYTSDWASDVDGWTVNNAGGGTVTLSNDTNRLKVDVSGMTTTGLRPALNFPSTIWSNITEGCSATITIEGSNLVVDGLFVDGTFQNITDHDLDTGTFTYTFTKAASNTAIIYFNSTGKGDYVGFLESVVITQTTADGAVSKWYDQSGNSNDAINADASEQPLVVSGGSVVTMGGASKPAIQGSTSLLALTTALTPTDFSIIHTSEGAGFVASVGNYIRISDYYRLNIAGNSYTSNDVNAPNQSIYVSNRNGTTLNLRRNGSEMSGSPHTSVTTALNITNFFEYSSLSYPGKMSEIIIFESDQSTNLTGMETNINDHFDIYTP